MKFCKDCGFYEAVNNNHPLYGMCTHPDVITRSPETGKLEYVIAKVERNFGKCGDEGKLFIQRLSELPTVMDTGPGGRFECLAKREPLTRQNCYERGFRFDSITRRFV